MKRIIIILDDCTEITVGYANSIYEWLLGQEDRIVVPFNGNINYELVHNIYYHDLGEFVTYKSI